MYIKPEAFEKAYHQLLYVTYQKNSVASFTSGLWNDEEGYKRKFWDKAREKLALDTWEEHKGDPGYILPKVEITFHMHDAWQNLVSLENYDKLFNVFKKKPRDSVSVVYDVFFSDDEEQAFSQLSKLISKTGMNDPISVASYFFFLKDKDRYVTARKQGTKEKLNRLGQSGACVQTCTWEGYQKFLTIVRELKAYLTPYYPDVTFLDAQSFLWMLWMIDRDTPQAELRESDDRRNRVDGYSELDDTLQLEQSTVTENNEASAGLNEAMPTEVVEGQDDPDFSETMEPTEEPYNSVYMEGEKKRTYGVKYERDPRVRAAFLRNQAKPYRCAVCGFCFEEVYGDLGNNFIEVHHIVPLSETGERPVDIATELVCLCSNCHRMIHRGKDHMLTVDELKTMVQK